MKIHQSFGFYFIVIHKPKETILDDIGFFKPTGEWFFNYPEVKPSYFQMEYCTPLPSNNGVHFNYIAIELLDCNCFLRDFKACYALNCFLGTVEGESVRYQQSYATVKVKELVRDSEQGSNGLLQYGRWTHIVKPNPDYFFFKDEEELLIGSKDYLQVKGWLSSS